ncbi:hypothetical protein O6H91_15G049900 [Diphasiastrum complanatum]|uniref:Uncharacterized protein n=1 Tax=Diphasiastrum complanatum TaxID=34168 RepID=A0ACC2BI51_DIPCM|nr:hypothetical protein O6H91_15G049900 [Diphasiastrum complanatum]
MNQEPPQRPITYGDLFDAQGELASELVIKEDASMMQSAEARVVGQTKRGGLPSMMQSAAERNLQTGAIDEDTRSIVASEGVSVVEMIVPGGVVDTEYVAGQPILQEVRSVPTVTVVLKC